MLQEGTRRTGLLGLRHQRRLPSPHTNSVALGDSAGWLHPSPPFSSETSRHPLHVDGTCSPCWRPTCPTGVHAPEAQCRVWGTMAAPGYGQQLKAPVSIDQIKN